MLQSVILLIWFGAIILGGWLLVRAAFRLTDSENILLGVAVGIIVENVLAAILCRWIPAPLGFYVCAASVLLFGVLAVWKQKTNLRGMNFRPFLSIIPFLLITAIMYSLARGMGIFDDFAHLPVVSLVAAGDIPPQFPLNREVQYAYHIFLILLAGQISRIGDIFVWSAMDLARSLSFTLAIFLGGMWTARLTRNRMVGWLGAMFIGFGGGARWLLLLVPPSILESISKQITLIGSGASSGFTLAEALLTEWRIEGVGKLPIPFSFTNGIVQPGVLSFQGANGLMNLVILLVLLLTCTRWKNWTGGAITAVVLSATSLVAEADLLLIAAGWGLITGIWLIQHKNWKLPQKLWAWGAWGMGAIILSLVQGGALLDIILNWFDKTDANYQTVGFAFSAMPSVVSSHLGVLPLLSWESFLVALSEIGPVLLVIPLLVFRAVKAYRRSTWFEAILLIGFLLTIGSVFIQFEGSTGVRNTSRLYSFLTLALIYFVPLTWNWASRKSEYVRITAATLSLMAVIGGLVLFASQLPAIQKPIIAPFMSEVDAKISEKYWNTLPSNAMVFDPVPSRSVIVFGRALEAGLTWYEYTPEWNELITNPDPVKIHLAGYDYIYLDEEAWNESSAKYQAIGKFPCAQLIESEKVWPGVIRKLYDVRNCTN